MRNLRSSKTFKKDFKRALRRGCDRKLLERIIDTLRAGKSLSSKQRDHALRGDWGGYRECHIQPDWLLIYKCTDTEVFLARTGSHADLFDM